MHEVSNLPTGDTTSCPRCRQAGRAVPTLTVKALANAQAQARLSRTDGFHFCATADCEVAYFRPASGELVLQQDVRVPIFQKSADPNRLVCYCFGHTVGSVQTEVHANGSSRILKDIKTNCAQGLDACERNNPQGSCCLGNVRRVIREAGARHVPPDTGNSCCSCGD